MALRFLAGISLLSTATARRAAAQAEVGTAWIAMRDTDYRVSTSSGRSGGGGVYSAAAPPSRFWGRQQQCPASIFYRPDLNFKGCARGMASMPASVNTTMIESTKGEDQQELTAEEKELYDYVARRMDFFHDHFRTRWSAMKAYIDPDTPAPSPELFPIESDSDFVALALEFAFYLETHHNIEESRVFPTLAERMPAFSVNEAMKEQHKIIHKGLSAFAGYMNEVKRAERGFYKAEVRELMVGNEFESTLLTHLEEEVKALGWEEMRKYWSVEEMKEHKAKW